MTITKVKCKSDIFVLYTLSQFAMQWTGKADKLRLIVAVIFQDKIKTLCPLFTKLICYQSKCIIPIKLQKSGHFFNSFAD